MASVTLYGHQAGIPEAESMSSWVFGFLDSSTRYFVPRKTSAKFRRASSQEWFPNHGFAWSLIVGVGFRL